MILISLLVCLLVDDGVVIWVDEEDMLDSDFASTDEDDLIDEEEFERRVRATREGIVLDDDEASKKKVSIRYGRAIELIRVEKGD